MTSLDPTFIAGAAPRLRRLGPACEACLAPLLVALAAIAVLAALFWVPAHGQALEQGVIIEEGTQFVRPDPAAPGAPPPAPGQPAAPAPAPAAIQPEPDAAPPAPPAPPPRYPQVVILLDVSDSMLNRGSRPAGTLLDEAKAALKEVIAGMPPEARVQLWTFATGLNKVRMPGESRSGFVPVGEKGSPARARLLKDIDALKTAGGTNLYAAISKVMDVFSARQDQAAYRSGERFPVLVVISDGEDWGKSRETFETVQETKGKFPLVTINTIGFNVSRDDKWFPQLCKIATRQQGCGTAGDQAALEAILESFYRAPGG
jgi:hypothetical protein